MKDGDGDSDNAAAASDGSDDCVQAGQVTQPRGPRRCACTRGTRTTCGASRPPAGPSASSASTRTARRARARPGGAALARARTRKRAHADAGDRKHVRTDTRTCTQAGTQARTHARPYFAPAHTLVLTRTAVRPKHPRTRPPARARRAPAAVEPLRDHRERANTHSPTPTRRTAAADTFTRRTRTRRRRRAAAGGPVRDGRRRPAPGQPARRRGRRRRGRPRRRPAPRGAGLAPHPPPARAVPTSPTPRRHLSVSSPNMLAALTAGPPPLRCPFYEPLCLAGVPPPPSDALYPEPSHRPAPARPAPPAALNRPHAITPSLCPGPGTHRDSSVPTAHSF